MKCLFLIILLFPVLAFSFSIDQKLSSPEEEARAEALFTELRCLVCTGQSIADSNADLAKDIRILIRDKIHSGSTDEQIKVYITSRYGDAVLLSPPFKASTYLLWGMPFILLIVGGWIILSYSRPLSKKI